MQAIDTALLRVMIGWGEASPPLWTAARALMDLPGDILEAALAGIPARA